MKRMITSALAVLLLAGAAQAQNPVHDRKGDRKEHRQEMAQLNLSADQKAKLKSIHEREKAELDALRGNTALSQEQRRTQGKAIRDKYQAERKAILTPEQAQKMEQFRAEHKDDRRGPGGRDTIQGRRPGPGEARGQRGGRMQEMQKELNLTADQQARLKAIREEYRPKMEAIRNDNSLTQEQKKTRAKELMKAQQEQMKSVLTAEQQQKMKSLRKGGRKDGAATR
ncbi:hypothetical protein [Flaviaesturariibacter terrae]